MDVYALMKWGVVIGATYATITQLWLAIIKSRRKAAGWWTHLCLGIICIYWLLYYLRSAIGFEPFNAHQLFVRAPLMLTIALIGAAGAYSVRRYK